MDELFDVYMIFPDGTNVKEYENLSAKAATDAAYLLTTRPAAMIGIISEVMITDKGDCCVFHWKNGEGVVWPKAVKEG
jgi:hypothetical protein